MNNYDWTMADGRTSYVAVCRPCGAAYSVMFEHTNGRQVYHILSLCECVLDGVK